MYRLLTGVASILYWAAQARASFSQILQQEECVAVGEIGLDTKNISSPMYMLSKSSILLRNGNAISKTSAASYSKGAVLALLKAHKFKLGGIAHAVV